MHIKFARNSLIEDKYFPLFFCQSVCIAPLNRLLSKMPPLLSYVCLDLPLFLYFTILTSLLVFSLPSALCPFQLNCLSSKKSRMICVSKCLLILFFLFCLYYWLSRLFSNRSFQQLEFYFFVFGSTPKSYYRSILLR